MLLDWKTQRRGKVGVLFVCMGNICRSPSAEGVCRTMAIRVGSQYMAIRNRMNDITARASRTEP